MDARKYSIGVLILCFLGIGLYFAIVSLQGMLKHQKTTTDPCLENDSEIESNLKHGSMKAEVVFRVQPTSNSAEIIANLKDPKLWYKWADQLRVLLQQKESERYIGEIIAIARTAEDLEFLKSAKSRKEFVRQRFQLNSILLQFYPNIAFEKFKPFMRYDSDMRFLDEWDIDKFGGPGFDKLSLKLAFWWSLFEGSALSQYSEAIYYMEELHQELRDDEIRRKDAGYYYERLSEGLAVADYVKEAGADRYQRLMNTDYGHLLSEIAPYLLHRNSLPPTFVSHRN